MLFGKSVICSVISCSENNCLVLHKLLRGQTNHIGNSFNWLWLLDEHTHTERRWLVGWLVGWVFCHTKSCRLFNAKSFHTYILRIHDLKRKNLYGVFLNKLELICLHTGKLFKDSQGNINNLTSYICLHTVFANGPGDLGSIPGRVIPKTLKMELDTTLLNTQHYKVRFKGKVEQSREWSSALPYTLV